MIKLFSSDIMHRLRERFASLYGPTLADRCLERMAMLVGRYAVGYNGDIVSRSWNQKDAVLIAYADMVYTDDEMPLVTLRRFLTHRLPGAINTVHVLPFFPYSSDDGFAVTSYREVHPDYGTWEDVKALGACGGLMFDLVLNHVSKQSAWFQHYTGGIAPYRDYFIEVDPDTDLSAVVRPRNCDLLLETQTRDGKRYVWTTFSDDQIDLNFANPDVLFEFLDVLFFYISMGARIIRLDAIAYLWKEVGTSCIHLPQTHEIVKLLRDVVEMVAPQVLLLTETNVPHKENISYFGNGDEAHMVYQFSLPPLLLHALQSGTATYLTRWAAGLPDPPAGCAFLNFSASHDGIGVRPLEGILPKSEIKKLLQGVLDRRGHVSSKTNSDGSVSPYELNITYFDALGEPGQKDDKLQVARFLCSQAVVLSLKGIPAIYFNSLLGAPNDYEAVEFTGQARAINRTKWEESELNRLLDDDVSAASRVLGEYTKLLRVRSEHPAFHPDGNQRVLDLGENIFALERCAPDGTETVVTISNFTASRVTMSLDGKCSAAERARQWQRNLVAGKPRGGTGHSLRLAPYETCWLLVSGTAQ